MLTYKIETKNALSRPQSTAIRKVSAAAAADGDGSPSNDDTSNADPPPLLAALAASPSWRLRAELRWRRLPVPDSDDVPTPELARRLVEGLEARAAEEGGGGGGGAAGTAAQDPRLFVDPSSPPSEAVCDTMVPSELRSALKAYGVRYPKAKADALAMLRAAMGSRGWPPPTPAEAAAEAARHPGLAALVAGLRAGQLRSRAVHLARLAAAQHAG